MKLAASRLWKGVAKESTAELGHPH